jgi:hypothetical protein
MHFTTLSVTPSINRGFTDDFLLLLLLLLLSRIYNPYEVGSPHSGGSAITHKDAPQSVGLLWTSDQPVAETST